MSADVIENLARLEHSRWMEEKRATGWRQDTQFDGVQRTDPALKEWGELAEQERELNRILVRDFLQELENQGYDIVKFPRTSRISAN